MCEHQTDIIYSWGHMLPNIASFLNVKSKLVIFLSTAKVKLHYVQLNILQYCY